jgi:hypothetical protein
VSRQNVHMAFCVSNRWEGAGMWKQQIHISFKKVGKALSLRKSTNVQDRICKYIALTVSLTDLQLMVFISGSIGVSGRTALFASGMQKCCASDWGL